MKKIAALVGAGALVLATVVPAFGWHPMFGSDNVAMVSNSATAVANTGGNSQSNVADVQHGGGVNVYGASGNRTMYTGDADAYAGALVVANTHVGCGKKCVDNHDDDVAMVRNGALASADTGTNGQDDAAVVRHGGGVTVGGGTGSRYLVTGDASSTSRAWTIVNTHLAGY